MSDDKKKSLNTRAGDGAQKLVIALVVLCFCIALLQKYAAWFITFGFIAGVILGSVLYRRHIRPRIRARQSARP